PDRDHVHVEGACAPRQALADPSIAEDAERLTGELAPRGRRGDADRPLTLPDATTERGVEASELPRQREHRAEHVFGDADLVAIGVWEGVTGGERVAVDAIQARARHLDELEAARGGPHLARERPADQHVDVA